MSRNLTAAVGVLAIVAWAAMAQPKPQGSKLFPDVFDDDWTPPARAEPKPVEPPATGPSATPQTIPPQAVPSKPGSDVSSPPPARLPSKPPVGPAPVPVPAHADKLLDVPASELQAASRKLMREVFARHLADTTPAGRQKLVTTLSAEAKKIQDNPVDRYVLLSATLQAAREAGDLDAVLKTADEMAGEYKVDALAIKVQFAGQMSFKAATPADTSRNLATGLALAERLLAVDDFTGAARLAQAMQSAAATDAAGRASIIQLTKDIAYRKTSLDRAAAASARLKTAPDDPAALLVVGSHLCFVKEEWDAGLPSLARCAHPLISAAATADVQATASDSAEAAGDAWWAAAERETAPVVQSVMRRRAGHWYRQALNSGQATGLKRTKLEMRLAELPANSGTSSADLARTPVVKSGARRPFRGGAGTLFASGDDKFQLAVNGKMLCEGGIEVVQTPVTLAIGDVITVKVTNSRYEKGFCCAVRFQDGLYLISHRQTWKSFTPKAEADWANPRGATGVVPAGRGQENYLFGRFNKVFPAAQEVLWTPDSKEQSAYLMLTVTDDCVIDPQAAIARENAVERHKGTLYANGDDSFVLYINGQRICEGGNGVVEVPVEVGVGDVVTVKGTNSRYEKGFCCVIKLANGKVIITDRSTWKTFAPRNELVWFDPSGVADLSPAGAGEPNYLREKFDKALPVRRDTLWTSDKRGVAYLTLKVTEASFVEPVAVEAKSSVK